MRDCAVPNIRCPSYSRARASIAAWERVVFPCWRGTETITVWYRGTPPSCSPSRRAPSLCHSISGVPNASAALAIAFHQPLDPFVGSVANRGSVLIRRPHSAHFISKTKTLSQNFERSEEHTSELQSRENLVCRLLLEKKK